MIYKNMNVIMLRETYNPYVKTLLRHYWIEFRWFHSCENSIIIQIINAEGMWKVTNNNVNGLQNHMSMYI